MSARRRIDFTSALGAWHGARTAIPRAARAAWLDAQPGGGGERRWPFTESFARRGARGLPAHPASAPQPARCNSRAFRSPARGPLRSRAGSATRSRDPRAPSRRRAAELAVRELACGFNACMSGEYGLRRLSSRSTTTFADQRDCARRATARDSHGAQTVARAHIAHSERARPLELRMDAAIRAPLASMRACRCADHAHLARQPSSPGCTVRYSPRDASLFRGDLALEQLGDGDDGLQQRNARRTPATSSSR